MTSYLNPQNLIWATGKALPIHFHCFLYYLFIQSCPYSSLFYQLCFSGYTMAPSTLIEDVSVTHFIFFSSISNRFPFARGFACCPAFVSRGKPGWSTVHLRVQFHCTLFKGSKAQWLLPPSLWSLLNLAPGRSALQVSNTEPHYFLLQKSALNSSVLLMREPQTSLGEFKWTLQTLLCLSMEFFLSTNCKFK